MARKEREALLPPDVAAAERARTTGDPPFFFFDLDGLFENPQSSREKSIGFRRTRGGEWISSEEWRVRT
ncbi:Mitochondrial carrier protein [Musa troglodytarum]|uniref:Mitochondrial carrier protein n=1 Tax=Musa troglodytarum TaxID=320322 RepID=A0A9E7F504_9LILI|nr:Mitochondrial carrier protein [Musa troglodytarum]